MYCKLRIYLSMRSSIIYNMTTLVRLAKDPRSCPNSGRHTSRGPFEIVKSLPVINWILAGHLV